MRITLEDSWEKVRWATQRFDTIRPEIAALERAQDFQIACDVDVTAGEYSIRVFDVKQGDPDWGLVLGDCLNNLRSALDYLAVRLYAIGARADPKDVAIIDFPIFDTQSKFDGNPTVKTFRENPALRPYLSRIEELQPFNESNPAVWGVDLRDSPNGPVAWPIYGAVAAALQRLNSLNNIEKHRVMHVIAQSGAVHFEKGPWPEEFKYLGGSGPYFGKLDKVTMVGLWRFQTPLPFEWKPTEVELKRSFPLEVSLDEPLPFKAVLKVVPFCIAAVRAVLTIFEPVFVTGQPAQPVTVTQSLVAEA